jgi:prepilin-type N-terminal cleavage/methylation domain-containing protein
MQRQLLPARGFTLIELLVVVTIIMILAGLMLSVFRYANVKAATDRARAEISALSLALEAYKIDNGDYPRATDSTDTLDASKNGDAHVSPSGDTPYMLASLVLYKALSGDANLDGRLTAAGDYSSGEKPRVYFEFKSSLLNPRIPQGGTRAANSINGVLDPFRNVYGYSTLGTASSGTAGYNPTFDLWSTADYESNKTGCDNVTQQTWIKNW